MDIDSYFIHFRKGNVCVCVYIYIFSNKCAISHDFVPINVCMHNLCCRTRRCSNSLAQSVGAFAYTTPMFTTSFRLLPSRILPKNIDICACFSSYSSWLSIQPHCTLSLDALQIWPTPPLFGPVLSSVVSCNASEYVNRVLRVSVPGFSVNEVLLCHEFEVYFFMSLFVPFFFLLFIWK